MSNVPPSLGLIDHALMWAGVLVAWLTGESSRVLVASGMGGMVRWLYSDKRGLRNGVVAVIGGAVAGQYLWPLILWALRMDQTPNNVAMAAFVAGTMGMSLVKVATAMAESQFTKRRGGDDA